MKEELEKEIQELSPFLADLKKQQSKEPFKIPRLYFDTLADKVLDKVKSETVVAQIPPQYKQHLTLGRRINNWLSTIMEPRMALSAFTLALVLGAGWYVINQQKKTIGTDNTSTFVTRDDVHNYINEHIDEFKEEDIILAFAETKSSKSSETEPEINIIDPILPTQNIQEEQRTPIHPKSGLTQDELEEYLKDNAEDNDIEAIHGKL